MSNKDAMDTKLKPFDNHQLNLLLLPIEILENVFTYLTYDETSSARQVCKLFNALCGKRLNVGFARAERLHGQIQREVKAKLPRRESERRSHALARHVDILSAVETRLSLLSMTYNRYIELGVVCFVPGKVLDEMFQVLGNINLSVNPPRAHEMLQELRDISSMAMEHFDEKIVPDLKQKQKYSEAKAATRSQDISDSDIDATMDHAEDCFCDLFDCTHSSYGGAGNKSGTSGIHGRPCHKELSDRSTLLQQHLAVYRLRVLTLERQLTEANKKLAKQERRLNRKSSLLDDLNRKMTEQTRRNFEFDQKFADVMKELTRVRGAGCPPTEGATIGGTSGKPTKSISGTKKSSAESKSSAALEKSIDKEFDNVVIQSTSEADPISAETKPVTLPLDQSSNVTSHKDSVFSRDRSQRKGVSLHADINSNIVDENVALQDKDSISKRCRKVKSEKPEMHLAESSSSASAKGSIASTIATSVMDTDDCKEAMNEIKQPVGKTTSRKRKVAESVEAALPTRATRRVVSKRMKN